jgi:hypothetical protein
MNLKSARILVKGAHQKAHDDVGASLRKTTMRITVLALLTALLNGCGGGDSDTVAYQQAIELANAKESEARVLGVDSPCDQVFQCSALGFTDPKDPCGMWYFKPYSLVSATALAAKAASDQQRELAARARALSPQPNVACIAIVKVPPVLACTASKCVPVL